MHGISDNDFEKEEDSIDHEKRDDARRAGEPHCDARFEQTFASQDG